MQCPSCKTEVASGTWFCPNCAEQIESDVQAPVSGSLVADLDDVTKTKLEEVSKTIAWSDSQDISAEALIVGNVLSVPARAFPGAVAREDGMTDSYRFYSSSGSVALDDPAAVPMKTGVEAPKSLTPYEGFVLDLVDGKKTVAEIQSSGLLAPAEIQVSILTLEDRGLLAIETPKGAIPTPAVVPMPTPEPLAEPPAPEAPPKLDVSFLTEIEPTPIPLPPGRSVPPKPAEPPRVAPSPPKAKMVELDAQASRPRAASLPPQAARGRASMAPKAEPMSEEVRLAKSRELFAAAQKDRAKGNAVSARMNLKLALAFDPTNLEYQQAFDQLGQAVVVASDDPLARLHPQAKKAFEDGCTAEAAGDLERAIRSFERALRQGDEPVVLNRLGVVLAMKKGEWRRGQELLAKAVELAPDNPIYLHNLTKILSRAAAEDLGSKSGVKASPEPPKPRGSFWMRLFGKK